MEDLKLKKRLSFQKRFIEKKKKKKKKDSSEHGFTTKKQGKTKN